jgi:hypothetical protein
MSLENLMKYKYAQIGATFLEKGKEDYVSAGICLKKLADDMGCVGEMKRYVDGSLASKEGIGVALSGSIEDYMNAYKNATIGDLWEFYGNNDLSDGEKMVYSAKLNIVRQKKLEELEEELKEKRNTLKEILEGNQTASQRAISGLNRDIKIYEEALGVIMNLEQYNYLTLVGPVQSESMKKQKKEVKKNINNIIGVN